MHDATLLKIVVAVITAAVTCGVFAVMRLHWRAYRKLPAAAALTPLHVTLVSGGVLQWGVALAWGQLATLGNPATWDAISRMVLFCTGGVTILAALAVVGGLQRRKVRIHQPVTQVTVTEVGTVSSEAAAAEPDRGDDDR